MVQKLLIILQITLLRAPIHSSIIYNINGGPNPSVRNANERELFSDRSRALERSAPHIKPVKLIEEHILDTNAGKKCLKLPQTSN
jgi:hypothetical protein